VKVLEVDLARKRIALSMRLDADAAPAARGERADTRPASPKTGRRGPPQPAATETAMAAAFAALRR
jgi:uncharacterized protein